MKAVFLALLLCCTVSSTTELSNTSSRNCSDPDLYKHYDNPIKGVGIASIVFFVPSIPSILGFCVRGVLAGSVAAAIHSLIGNVESGSPFAVCQYLGTTILAFSPIVLIALVIALVVLCIQGYVVPWYECEVVPWFSGAASEVGSVYIHIWNAISLAWDKKFATK